jgi:hypothetical protein
MAGTSPPRRPSRQASTGTSVRRPVLACFARRDCSPPVAARSAANEDVFRSYASAVPSHFYRRRWDETRGDEFDSSGHSLWYFDTDDEGRPIRQVELYDAGRVLRYSPGHSEDRYGSLGQVSLYDSDEDWSTFEITEVEFERVWRTHDE